jgi:N-acetylneuraminic acid mutarotase
MNRISTVAVGALMFLSASVSRAHFPFIVPVDAQSAKLILSETLDADDEVAIEIIAGTTLESTDTAGVSTPVVLEKPADHAFKIALPGQGARVIHGTSDLGVVQRGNSPAHRLIYYPKTILGDVANNTIQLKNVPVELVPAHNAGGIKLLLLIDGKPAPAQPVRVIEPDGSQDEYITDNTGYTKDFAATGRYGAWARHWVDATGNIDGKPYMQIRHYATLVFEHTPELAAESAPPATQPVTSELSNVQAQPFGHLPEPSASFGATLHDGWLYIYGGHIGQRHDYSTQTVTGNFSRLNLADPTRWESLPGGVSVQGMNLATYAGKIYRAGGMRPRNAPDQPEDNISENQAAVFDPSTRLWTPLPVLPVARSSHDVIVIDHTLYVVGGWLMQGSDEDQTWLSDMHVLDLKSTDAKWKSIPQPFARRALIAAAVEQDLYVMGGFDADDKPQLEVDIFNTTTRQWRKGPSLPGPAINGFAPAAAVVNKQLYVSVATGQIYRLSPAGDTWQPVARATPRIVHRIVAHGTQLILIGGARGDTMTDIIETIDTATIK